MCQFLPPNTEMPCFCDKNGVAECLSLFKNTLGLSLVSLGPFRNDFRIGGGKTLVHGTVASM